MPLDEGKRCAGLVLRALAPIYDVPPPADAQQRRALWERAGVAEDELSSTVIAAGFRADGDDVVSRILRVCADAGEAAILTLRQLRAGIRVISPDAWVFENPSVVALALARFGDRCPPIVCTSGWPSSAGILLLLRSLGAASTRLRTTVTSTVRGCASPRMSWRGPGHCRGGWAAPTTWPRSPTVRRSAG
jgi:uncharacterized protein (TIGR02679 family)